MSGIFLLMAGLGFATVKMMPTVAGNISVKAAAVKMVQMGPMGQAKPMAGDISTEMKMDVINSGTEMAKLVAATTPIAQKVQLHHFVEKDGKTVMQQIQSIDIAAHSEDDLSYQGVHIMLMGLKSPLIKDQKIPLTLIFSDGSYVHINAIVG